MAQKSTGHEHLGGLTIDSPIWFSGSWSLAKGEGAIDRREENESITRTEVERSWS